MSHIDIRRSHELGHEAARQAAVRIADHLNESFQLTYEWDGDVLHFRRTGVQGRMYVEPAEVRVVVRLGLMLLPLRGRFETEIHRYMDDLFESAQEAGEDL